MRYRLGKISLWFALVALASALTPLGGHAQERPQDVRRLLERLDDELRKAEQVLAVAPSAALDDQLWHARHLRNEAVVALQSRNYSLASAKAKEALRLIEKIRQEILRGPVQTFVRRYQDLLRKAELAVPSSGDKEAERLLNKARKSAREAKRLASQGRFEQATARYREAIFLLQTCLNRLKKGTQMQDQVEAARRRFEALRGRLSGASVDGVHDPKTRALVQQIRDEAQRAAKAEAASQWNVALVHYNRAIRLLYRILDRIEPPAERALRELDQLLRNYAVTAPESRTKRLLRRRAERLRDEAWQALRAGKPGLAVKKALLARRLLEAAGRTASDNSVDKSAGLRRELERYRVAIARARRVSNANDLASRQLLRLAARQAQLAHRALQAGRPGVASRHLLVGYRLLGIVESEKLGIESTSGDLEQQIRETRARVERLSGTEGETPSLRAARRLLQQAKRALERGDDKTAAGLNNAARLLLNSVRSGKAS